MLGLLVGAPFEPNTLRLWLAAWPDDEFFPAELS